MLDANSRFSVISYQELLGSYNTDVAEDLRWVVISYQELLGSYNR